jgi:hypothetical protein
MRVVGSALKLLMVGDETILETEGKTVRIMSENCWEAAGNDAAFSSATMLSYTLCG